MKIKLSSAGRVLNVRVTRPRSAWMEGTELSGKNSEGQGLRELQGGDQGV